MIDQPYIDNFIAETRRLGTECARLQAENDRLRRGLQEIVAIKPETPATISAFTAMSSFGRLINEMKRTAALGLEPPA